MTTVWCSVVAAQYRSALDDMAITLRGCPDDLWEASIYKVKKTDQWVWPPTDRDGQPFDDPAVRERKFQATSAVWRTASHALWFTDLDLSDMETDWAPPAPFSPGDEEAYVVPPTYSREQVFGYIDHCRRKVDRLFGDLTDDQAAAQLAKPHRNCGTSLAAVLVQGVVHLQLHSAQVRTSSEARASVAKMSKRGGSRCSRAYSLEVATAAAGGILALLRRKFSWERPGTNRCRIESSRDRRA